MVAIVDAGGTGVTALGGGYRIEAAANAALPATAVSATPIAGDFALRVRVGAGDHRTMVGVTADPGEGAGFEQIDYAIQFFRLECYIYERAVFRPPSRMSAGTAWIVREGGVLRYLIGSRPSTALVARTVPGVTGPLYFDSAIYRVGLPVEVRFEAPGAWCEEPRARRRVLGLATGAHLA